MENPPTEMPRVVIVGAGFGGLEAAKKLACKDVRVTVIDRTNYHLFQPLLYQVSTAALSPAAIAAPLAHGIRVRGKNHGRGRSQGSDDFRNHWRWSNWCGNGRGDRRDRALYAREGFSTYRPVAGARDSHRSGAASAGYLSGGFVRE